MIHANCGRAGYAGPVIALEMIPWPYPAKHSGANGIRTRFTIELDSP
jgi:hypothetical protein